MRRFHRRGFRRKPPMQWVPNADWTPNEVLVIAVAAATLKTTVLVDAGAGASASAVPNIARMTINRIRGQIGVVASTAASVLSAGIFVQEIGSGSNANPSPSIQGDADASWLWLRHIPFRSAGTTSLAAFQNDIDQVHFGSEIDVKVRRALRPNERLVMQLMSTQACSVNLAVRSLISRVA